MLRTRHQMAVCRLISWTFFTPPDFRPLFWGFWSLFLEVMREHFKREHQFLALFADSHFWKLANHRHFR